MSDHRAFVSLRFSFDIMDATSDEDAILLTRECLPDAVVDLMDEEGFVLWDVVVTLHDPKLGFPEPIDTDEWRE